MRRRNARIDVRLHVKPWCASVLVRKHARTCGDIGLARNSQTPFGSAHLQSLLKRSQQLWILTQFQSERFGNHLPGDVIRGWTEAAGDEKNLAMRKQLAKRATDRISVANCAPLLDSQT